MQHKEQDRLNDTFDTSSEKNRNFLFGFLAAQLYVLVTVGGTTDLDLVLASSSFNLPIVNVPVPLIGFYLFAPLLLLVFHINLLFNLSEHVKILDKWQKTKSDSELHFPYVINVLAAMKARGKNGVKLFLVRAIATFSIILLPLFIFLYIQIRFSDYHSIGITIYQAVIFFIDFYVLHHYITTLNINLFHVNFDLKILKRMDKLIKRFSYSLVGMISIFNVAMLSMVLWFTDVAKDYVGSGFIPVLDVQEKSISQIKSIYKNTMTPKIKEQQKEIWTLYNSINLKGRHFELANFISVSLYNADLRGSNLKGANLSSAQFQNADLKRAKLQGAILSGAHLQSADFSNAYLEGANLEQVRLRGAKLVGAQLQGASLLMAQLQNANLLAAQLQGASLSGALLRGADLSAAQFRGASLSGIQLQGVTLSRASFDGADLSRASLQGANLSYVSLQGADLTSASLQGANLSHASLVGARLSHASLQGASLRKANLYGTDLSYTSLQGADLNGAYIDACYIQRAEMFQTRKVPSLRSCFGSPNVMASAKNRLRNGNMNYAEKKSWDKFISAIKPISEDGLKRLFEARDYVITHKSEVKHYETITSSDKPKIKVQYFEKRRRFACTNKWVAKSINYFYYKNRSWPKANWVDTNFESYLFKKCPKIAEFARIKYY